MLLWIAQHAGFILRVQLYPRVHPVAQGTEGHIVPIDTRDVVAGAANHPPQLVHVATGHLKYGTDRRIFGLAANKICTGALSADQSQTAEQQALARTGLTRDGNQAGAQYQVGVFHQNQILYCQTAEH